MSLSKWLPCDFEQCHPLLWGGGILVDHWSTISSFWFDSQEQTPVTFESKYNDFYWWKIYLKMSAAECSKCVNMLENIIYLSFCFISNLHSMTVITNIMEVINEGGHVIPVNSLTTDEIEKIWQMFRAWIFHKVNGISIICILYFQPGSVGVDRI